MPAANPTPAPVPDPEFDRYAQDYETLLADPIRDAFAGESAFFHQRKWDLIRDHFGPSRMAQMDWLDVGCGKGELLSLGKAAFRSVAGCDPSAGMMSAVQGVPIHVQTDPRRLPFADQSFDFVTSVCVYHHVRPEDRPQLSAEIARVLRPGGTFAIIEHNPWNPATRLIVSRTPVDADAILLTAGETKRLQRGCGLRPSATPYFLYLPRPLYRYGAGLEKLFAWLPLGGQYASFAQKP